MTIVLINRQERRVKCTKCGKEWGVMYEKGLRFDDLEKWFCPFCEV